MLSPHQAARVCCSCLVIPPHLTMKCTMMGQWWEWHDERTSPIPHTCLRMRAERPILREGVGEDVQRVGISNHQPHLAVLVQGGAGEVFGACEGEHTIGGDELGMHVG